MLKFYHVTLTDDWIEQSLGYYTAENHAELSDKMLYPNKRITNERFRDIEKTGLYYRITEQGKGGKSFIFEIQR